MKNYFFFLLIFFVKISFSQNAINAFIVNSETKKAVKDATIFNQNAGLKVYSDSTGFFTFQMIEKLDAIYISHVAYEVKKISVKDLNKADTIFLEPKKVALRTVEINAEKFEKIKAESDEEILDFEFYGQWIAVVGKQIKQKYFFVEIIDRNGQRNYFKTIDFKPKSIFKDCLGNLYLLNNHHFFHLTIQYDSLVVENKGAIKNFEMFVKSCLGAENQQFHLETRSADGFSINYIYYSDSAQSKIYKQKTIANAEKQRQVRDEIRFASTPGFAYREEDHIFAQKMMFKPLYAPLFVLKNNLLLFNLPENKIEILDKQFKNIQEKNITFHLNKGFKDLIILDEKRQSAYAIFENNGIKSLHQILIENGDIIKITDFKGFPLPEQMKVNDGELFFIWNQKNGLSRNLFKMEI